MVNSKEAKDQKAVIKNLNRIFNPRSIAVIGASNRKGSIGNLLFSSIVKNGYKGKLYPVSASSGKVMSQKAVRSILEIDGPVDLAIIAVPASNVLQMADECGRKGVKAIIVISDGFRESGSEGEAMETTLKESASQYGMRIIGPNCMGFINTDPDISLNATFSLTLPKRGNIALLSQSGALCVAAIKYFKNLETGFSTIISVGNRSDIGPSDMLRYWENEKTTKVIIMYLESFDNPEMLKMVSKRISLKKPVLALKGGETPAGSQAANTHTGAIATEKVVTEAFFHRAGIIQVETMQGLFQSAMLLSGQPVPKGGRVAIITNGGGPGTLAADAAADGLLMLPDFSTTLKGHLKKKIIRDINVSNPLDLTANSPDTEMEACTRILIESLENDAVIIIYVPPAGEDIEHIEAVIERIAPVAKKRGKPILVCFAGDRGLKGKYINKALFVPYFAFPEEAVSALSNAVRYGEMLRSHQGIIPSFRDADSDACKKIIKTFLSGTSGKSGMVPINVINQIFAGYGIQTVETRVAKTPEEAMAAAIATGFPVAIKLASSTITHKSDVRGVILGVETVEEVFEAFNTIQNNLEKRGLVHRMEGVTFQRMVTGGMELFIGVKRDNAIGHVIMFGAGGIYTELINDTITMLLPLTDMDAEEMIQATRVKRMLTGYRGLPLMDTNAIKDLLLRISRMVKDIPEINEMDINPVKVLPKGKGYAVLDARMLVG